MKTKELIEALKMDAEWAEGHEYDAPICLREHLLEAAKILFKAIFYLDGNCEYCKYNKVPISDDPCYTCIYGLEYEVDKTNNWTPFWEEDEETEKSTC